MNPTLMTSADTGRITLTVHKFVVWPHAGDSVPRPCRKGLSIPQGLGLPIFYQEFHAPTVTFILLLEETIQVTVLLMAMPRQRATLQQAHSRLETRVSGVPVCAARSTTRPSLRSTGEPQDVALHTLVAHCTTSTCLRNETYGYASNNADIQLAVPLKTHRYGHLSEYQCVVSRNSAKSLVS